MRDINNFVQEQENGSNTQSQIKRKRQMDEFILHTVFRGTGKGAAVHEGSKESEYHTTELKPCDSPVRRRTWGIVI